MTLCSEYHVDAHDLERFFLTHIIEEEGDNAFNVTFDSEIPQIPQDVALLRLGCCINWNSDQFNCFLYSSLKSLVIGPGSCSRVHAFWLDNMPKLHTLNIECYAFSDPNSLIDGTLSQSEESVHWRLLFPAFQILFGFQPSWTGIVPDERLFLPPRLLLFYEKLAFLVIPQ